MRIMTVNDRMVGRVPLCAEVLNHRRNREVYPRTIQSFINLSLGRRENSAQSSLPSITPLGEQGALCASLSLLFTGLSPGLRHGTTAEQVVRSVHQSMYEGTVVYPGVYTRVYTMVVHREAYLGSTHLVHTQGGYYAGYTPVHTQGSYYAGHTGCIYREVHREATYPPTVYHREATYPPTVYHRCINLTLGYTTGV